jgi:putative sterol carrier protein
MTDATAEFFAQLGKRGREPLVKNATGTLRVELAHGKRTERWLVALDKGEITVSRRNAAADSVVRTTKALFDRMVTGEANAMAATLRGEIDGEGDLALILLFQRLLPGPPAKRRKRRRAGPATKR